MIEIMENSIIEWPSSEKDGEAVLERVLWCDPGGEFIFVINLNNKKPLPIKRLRAEVCEDLSQGLALRRTFDPFQALRNPDPAFLAKHRDHMEKNWDIIKDIVAAEPAIYDRETRGELLKTLKVKISTKHLYSLLRDYWTRGKFRYALLPAYSKCGGPDKQRIGKERGAKRGRPTNISLVIPEMSGVNVDESMLAIFRRSYKVFYDTSEQHPLKKAYELMLIHHFSSKDQFGNIITAPSHLVPTFNQFEYWYHKERDLEKSLQLRLGKRYFNLNHRPLLIGSTGLAPGPGEIYQIDATIADVYLVNRFNRLKIIGRPVIYFCIDVFSRMVVGVHVALEGPSWTTGMMALANAFFDKVDFCKQYGIDIEPYMWPSYGLPKQITADRGEFLSMNSDTLVDNLNITIANCPPFRADWKGIVERTFRKANEKMIHWLPGAVRKRLFGTPDPKFEAKIDIYEFTQLIICLVLHHNLYHHLDTRTYPLDRDLMRDGVTPIPIDLWHWGIQNRTGRLREETPLTVMLSLMPREKARITRSGIKFANMFYICNTAVQCQWFLKAGRSGGGLIDISYDPRKPEIIYFHQSNGNVEPCYRIAENDHNKCIEGLFYEEVLEYKAIGKMSHKWHQSTTNQSAASYMQLFDNVVKSGTTKTDAAIAEDNGLRKKLSGKDIKINAAQENALLREEQAWVLVNNDKVEPDVAADSKTLPEVSIQPLLEMHNKSFLEQIKALDGEGS